MWRASQRSLLESTAVTVTVAGSELIPDMSARASSSSSPPSLLILLAGDDVTNRGDAETCFFDDGGVVIGGFIVGEGALAATVGK